MLLSMVCDNDKTVWKLFFLFPVELYSVRGRVIRAINTWNVVFNLGFMCVRGNYLCMYILDKR